MVAPHCTNPWELVGWLVVSIAFFFFQWMSNLRLPWKFEAIIYYHFVILEKESFINSHCTLHKFRVGSKIIYETNGLWEITCATLVGSGLNFLNIQTIHCSAGDIIDLKILSHRIDASKENQQEKVEAGKVDQSQEMVPYLDQELQCKKHHHSTEQQCVQQKVSRHSPHQQVASTGDQAESAANEMQQTRRKPRTSVGETLAHGSHSSVSRSVPPCLSIGIFSVKRLGCFSPVPCQQPLKKSELRTLVLITSVLDFIGSKLCCGPSSANE